MDGTRVILTDIEGTTSSIAFVKQTLFPYARARLPEFLHDHQHEPRVQRELERVRDELGAPAADLAELTRALQRWIDEDRKHGALKALQGLLWARGYEEGVYRAPVYDDAAHALRAFRARGLRLAVYSSGSIEAQRLFFRHSDHGDLTPLFEAHFDTGIGPKTSPTSYTQIARTLETAPCEILFLSDSEAELDAARAAGCATTWLARPEDRNPSAAELEASRHPFVRNFAELAL